MPDSLTDRFMERIKATIAADLTRLQSAGLPPRALRRAAVSRGVGAEALESLESLESLWPRRQLANASVSRDGAAWPEKTVQPQTLHPTMCRAHAGAKRERKLFRKAARPLHDVLQSSSLQVSHWS